MREIKFRAYCHLNEKMLSPLDIEERTLRMLDGDNDQTYMQFTGLKDKNGKEIYEGDIVESKPTREIGDDGWPESVPSKYTKVSLDPDEGFGFILDVCLGSENELEVIGNIYENPELLES